MKPFQSPETLLQKLIQFDTTNPPGNERECILFLRDLLAAEGIDCRLYEKDPQRPNLLARIPGSGKAPPLLLYGHVDVVTTVGQDWTKPPFSGVIEDGYIWGRGALDMKGGIAMMVSAVLRIVEDGFQPAGDIVLLVLADEENTGDYGAKFMVDEHPEVFKGVRFALGEFGGFNFSIGGKRFYPIQVAEKQVCGLRIVVRGPGGHGAAIIPGNAASKMGKILSRISRRRMPVRVTAPVRLMIKEMASGLGFPMNVGLRLLLFCPLTDLLLGAMGTTGLTFAPMLHNTVNVTQIQGGVKLNVVPSMIEASLDGRMLPGVSPDEFLAEFRKLIGDDGHKVEISVELFEPGPDSIEMDLFDLLGDQLRSLDPEGIPVPYLLTAVTDGRHLARLGIQSYGFIPMKVPEDFEFFKYVHASDERVPVEAINFGAKAIYQVIRAYRG
jgi:acetylornithine deacetylase/succinyl-diaminopimelate desuccinylase-like protein